MPESELAQAAQKATYYPIACLLLTKTTLNDYHSSFAGLGSHEVWTAEAVPFPMGVTWLHNKSPEVLYGIQCNKYALIMDLEVWKEKKSWWRGCMVEEES